MACNADFVQFIVDQCSGASEAESEKESVQVISNSRYKASMNRWIPSSPSRNRRFEIRSVWSTKQE